jgi:hypothetical protein
MSFRDGCCSRALYIGRCSSVVHLETERSVSWSTTEYMVLMLQQRQRRQSVHLLEIDRERREVASQGSWESYWCSLLAAWDLVNKRLQHHKLELPFLLSEKIPAKCDFVCWALLFPTPICPIDAYARPCTLDWYSAAADAAASGFLETLQMSLESDYWMLHQYHERREEISRYPFSRYNYYWPQTFDLCSFPPWLKIQLCQIRLVQTKMKEKRERNKQASKHRDNWTM